MNGIILMTLFLSYTKAQNCTFPCEWIGKTFVSTSDQLVFDENGINAVQVLSKSQRKLECFKKDGRFLIVSSSNGQVFQCFSVEIESADCFTVFSSAIQVGLNTYCQLCHTSDNLIQYKAVGAVCDTITSPPCNHYPKCEPSLKTCIDTGSIGSGTCDQTTTEPASTGSPSSPPPSTESPSTPLPSTESPSTTPPFTPAHSSPLPSTESPSTETPYITTQSSSTTTKPKKGKPCKRYRKGYRKSHYNNNEG